MDPKEPGLEIYAAVGECLHAWSSVETQITHLFMLLHDQPWDEFSHPLRTAFESVVSLEARLSMIKATVSADTKVGATYPDHFNRLYNKLMRSYRKRHEIAHFMMVGQFDPGDIAMRYVIRPFFNWREFTAQKGVELSLKQINERKDGFYSLIGRVQQHIQYVGRKKGLPAGFYAQAGDLVHPDLDSGDQTLEE